MNNKPHKHAELIKKWADGAEIQYSENGRSWSDCLRTPSWNLDTQYRVKPEVTTSLSEDTLREVYYSKCPYPPFPGRESHAPWFHQALKAVADTAIKQYIKEQK